MGITKYGVWSFFKTEEEAKECGKEMNKLFNRYGVCIMDKLKVQKGNSIKFFLSNKQAVEELTFKINSKYTFTMMDNKWKLDISNSEFTKEAEDLVKKLNKAK